MNRPQSQPVRDGGQAAILVVIIGATLFVALITALSVLGGRAVDRTRAQTAADAAALASLEGGHVRAETIAHRHGAIVVSWQRGPGPDEVTVVVRVGESTAIARATNGLDGG